MKLGQYALCFIAIMVMCIGSGVSFGQTRAFSYQGSLQDSGGFADGLYDFRFLLFDAESNGNQVGSNSRDDVEVVDGLFTVELNYLGGQFEQGENRWLEIGVKAPGDPSYTTLNPRVRITSAPFATHARSADHADEADLAMHADSAGYASSGPFEPLDTTPNSRSGGGDSRSFIISHELRINNKIAQGFEVEFPIELSRSIDFNGGGQGGHIGPMHDVCVTVSRVYSTDSPWNQFFRTLADVQRLDIQFTSEIENETTYRFSRGVITSYSLEFRTGLGIYETMKIEFPFNPNRPIHDVFEKIQPQFSDTMSNSFYPYQGGGSAIEPGNLWYELNGDIYTYSTPTVLPSENMIIDFGAPAGGVSFEPIEMITNSFIDSPVNPLSMFIAGDIVDLELHSTQGVVWRANGPGAITKWSLDRAMDGGLYERIEFIYAEGP